MGACVQVNVLLVGCSLSSGFIATPTPLILKLLQQPHRPKNANVHVRIHSSDEHRLYQLRPDFFVPVLVQIGVLIVDGNQSEWVRCIFKLRIGHQQNDARIDELRPENSEHNQTDLHADCVVADCIY